MNIITTGNGNDTVIRPVFDAQGRVIRSSDRISILGNRNRSEGAPAAHHPTIKLKRT